MIETALVYIRKADETKEFVGCGALIEGPYIATCRHVWRDADGEANGGVIVEFPRNLRDDGEFVQDRAMISYACDSEKPLPDLVLLGVGALPPGVMTLSVAPEERYETGAGRIHAFVPSVGMDVFVKGVIEAGTVALGLRQISGEAAPGYWTEKGSSGAPAFIDGGMQLAGILRLSETGDPPIRQAFILPGSAIRRQLERMKADAVTVEVGFSLAEIEQAIPGLDLKDTPVNEIAAKIAAAVAAINAKAAEAPAPSNAGSDIDAARTEAADKLGDMDTDGALAVWDEMLAKDSDALETLTLRRVAMLAEKAEVQKLRLEYSAALTTLQEAVELYPDAFVQWIEIGDIEFATGTSAAARTAYQAALEAAKRKGSDRDISVCFDRTGKILLVNNDLAGALSAFEECLGITRRLAAANPSHTERARDVSVSLERVGDLRITNNDLAGALTAFSESLKISKQLFAKYPNHSEHRRDVSLSYIRIGDVHLARNELTMSMRAYKRGLVIQRSLLSKLPVHHEVQRDIVVSLNKIGDVLVAQDQSEGALAIYEEGLEKSRALARADPSNSEAARDVSASFDRIGDVLLLRTDHAGALTAHKQALEIRRRLFSADPSHAERMRDLSVSLSNIGDVCSADNDFAGALRAYEEALEIRLQLMKAAPNNAQRGRDAGVTLKKVGQILGKTGESKLACARFAEALAIIRPLAARAPDIHQLQQDLANIQHEIARANCPH